MHDPHYAMHDMQTSWNEIAGPIPTAGELEAREDAADNTASDLSEIVSPTKIVAKTGDCLQLVVHNFDCIVQKEQQNIPGTSCNRH